MKLKSLLLKLGRSQPSRRLSLIVLLLSLVSVFQNCGEPHWKADTLASSNQPQGNCLDTSTCQCSFNGESLNVGETVRAFQNSSVPVGQVCQSEERRCNGDGTLTGRFEFSRCGVAVPADCLFNGVTINHGSQVQAYRLGTLPAGQSCNEYPTNVESRSCNNGQLSGSFTFSRCQNLVSTTSTTRPTTSTTRPTTTTTWPSTSTTWPSTSTTRPTTTTTSTSTTTTTSTTTSTSTTTTTTVVGQGNVIPSYTSVGSYSEYSRMRIPGGFYFGNQATSRDNFYHWTYSTPANEHPKAIIHWSTADDYQEDYRIEGQWISLDGWNVRYDPIPGMRIKYKIQTTKAIVTFRPGSSSEVVINVTEAFIGRGHPYVLDSIPNFQYQLYVEGDLVQFSVQNQVETRTTAPAVHFKWTVNYLPPAIMETAFHGSILSIKQSEHWVDDNLGSGPNGTDVWQDQTICQGFGYICRSVRGDGSVVGVTAPYSP